MTDAPGGLRQIGQICRFERVLLGVKEKVPPVGNSLDRGATGSLLGKPKSDARSVDIACSNERVEVAAAKLLAQLLGQVPEQATSRQP